MIETRIFNTPLAIHPAKAEVILGVLSDRLGIIEIESLNADTVGIEELNERNRNEGYYETYGRIALIRIHGTLVQRSSGLSAFSGLRSYENISSAFHTAMDDPSIDAIYLDVDSGGGEVAGCFDCVESMVSRVNEKPIHAHINEYSASAAYALTSVADHISIARTGYTGSIGALIIHREYSKMMDMEGIKATIFRAGEEKARFNQYETLRKKDKEDVQALLENVRDIFVSTVARNRGISEETVRATEAAMYGPEEALKLGLVDAIMSSEEAGTHLMESLQG